VRFFIILALAEHSYPAWRRGILVDLVTVAAHCIDCREDPSVASTQFAERSNTV
jgi:hypothetical protein